MAKKTVNERNQENIQELIGSYKLSVSGVYPQDDGSTIAVDVAGQLNNIPVKYITKTDEDGKPMWVVGVF
jgi:hypothetical protein|tara:strand:- start:1093 stop:1302 length:210 start_codon:yes stop_codon:yes gene_type:complete